MQDKTRDRQNAISGLDAIIQQRAEELAESLRPTVCSELPPGTPLTLGIDKASDVFDISERSLRRLIKLPGFPCMQVGSTHKILTYKALKWFEDHQGERIYLPN